MRIVEKLIGSISSLIKVKLNIDKSIHAGERQYRDSNSFISEDDIIKTANLALDTIAKMLLLDKLNVGDAIHIKNTKTDLNIIGSLNDDNGELELVIVTVMEKKNFLAKKGTKTIKV